MIIVRLKPRFDCVFLSYMIKMRKTKDIALQERKVDIEIDFPLFCKYNQYYRFLAEVYLQYQWIDELPKTDTKQIVLYELFDQTVKKNLHIYDYEGITKEEQHKLDTLFTIIVKDEYDEFVNKIALLDEKHPLKLQLKKESKTLKPYEAKAKELLEQIDKLSLLQHSEYEDVEISINVRSVNSTTSNSKTKSLDNNKRVILNGYDFVKHVVDKAREHLLLRLKKDYDDISEKALLKLNNNLKLKTVPLDNRKADLSKSYLYYLYRLIASFIETENLTINNNKLSKEEVLTLACDILAKTDRIPLEHLNKPQWKHAKEYIRKAGKIYWTEKRNKYWDIEEIFKIIMPYSVPTPIDDI